MRFFKIFSLLSVSVVLLYIICFSAEGSIYNDVVRMHVIANSDSETDQQIKMEVRDMVLEKYGSRLSAYKNKDMALTAAISMLSEIENEVNTYLSTRTNYVCRATVEERYFPTKTYGEYSLPKGNYTALCIRLGEAEGGNFFCVLYPPLCLGASACSGEELFVSCGLDKNEYELMRNEKTFYRLKFRLLELFN